MYEVEVSIDGERIDAEALILALRSFLRLLKEMDKSLSSKQTIRWRLRTLSYQSPATIGFIGEPKTKSLPSNAPAVADALRHGVNSLGRRERPGRFSDEAMTLTKQLADLQGRHGIASLAIAVKNGAAPQRAPLTAAVSDYVNELIGPRTESLGTLEGRLELIAARRGGLACAIHERASGKAVRCDVPTQMKPEVLKYFDSEVIASGIVRRDASGQARQIDIHSIAPAPSKEGLPQSIRGLDPDLTEGLEPADWLKGRW